LGRSQLQPGVDPLPDRHGSRLWSARRCEYELWGEQPADLRAPRRGASRAGGWQRAVFVRKYGFGRAQMAGDTQQWRYQNVALIRSACGTKQLVCSIAIAFSRSIMIGNTTML